MSSCHTFEGCTRAGVKGAEAAGDLILKLRFPKYIRAAAIHAQLSILREQILDTN
jgi:hypothetical protein